METAQSLYRTMVWRTMVTVLILVIALVGSLIYVAFYATGMDLFQKIVVVLIALIVAVAVVSVVWMLGWSKYMNKKTMMQFKDWKQK